MTWVEGFVTAVIGVTTVVSLPAILATVALLLPLEYSDHCGGRVAIGHAPAGGPYVPRDLRTEAAVCWVGLAVATVVATAGNAKSQPCMLLAAINWVATHSALASISKEMCPNDSTLKAGFWFVHATMVAANWQLALRKPKGD
jgi:hypothetical protein